MPNRIVVGAQWGDEGKGKIVDLLSEQADIIARYQGGANAGHTVIYNNHKLVLHQIPCGILRPKKICVIGNGVVVDLARLLEELQLLKKARVNPKGRLWISQAAHLVMPYHQMLEKFEEERRGKNKIGTTLRGIGPAYEDKTGRRGIRLGDLDDKKALLARIENNLKYYRRQGSFRENGVSSAGKVVSQILKRSRIIKSYIVDTSEILHSAIQKGKSLLLEGAQGTLLDLDFGTYPYSTSSNTTSGGACTGLGIGPTAIDEVIGVAKAYTTRVGNGPFPTELKNSLGEYLRQAGEEFGATTSRPRRCGWLDLVILKYSVRINGISNLVITKLDVLDKLPEIKIATAYKYKGRTFTDFPQDVAELEKVQPVYKTMPGWKSSTSGLTSWNKLPPNAKKYIRLISAWLGVPVFLISTGSRREEIIRVR